MNQQDAKPVLIQGGQHSDPRGTISFVNDFDFRGVDRFYWVVAGEPNVFRGWAGHRREQKWFTVIQGEVLLAVVCPDDWERPSRDLPVERYSLFAARPQVLHVPPGHATGSMSLQPGSILMIFSSGRIENARADDFRFPADQWPVHL